MGFTHGVQREHDPEKLGTKLHRSVGFGMNVRCVQLFTLPFAPLRSTLLNQTVHGSLISGHQLEKPIPLQW